MKKTIGAALSVFIAVATAAFILTFSIAVPILARPFYYAQIDSLDLERTSGFTKQQITDAYDEVLDYCTGASDTFGTGELKWSLSGKAHFDDVRKLFILDFRILFATFAALVITAVFCVKSQYKPVRCFGLAPCFYSAVLLILLFAVAGAALIFDFDAAFTAFHSVFFPGKSNWIFDRDKDQIILILPERFFFNCAVLIIAVASVLCAVCVAGSVAAKARAKKSAAKAAEKTA